MTWSRPHRTAALSLLFLCIGCSSYQEIPVATLGEAAASAEADSSWIGQTVQLTLHDGDKFSATIVSVTSDSLHVADKEWWARPVPFDVEVKNKAAYALEDIQRFEIVVHEGKAEDGNGEHENVYPSAWVDLGLGAGKVGEYSGPSFGAGLHFGIDRTLLSLRATYSEDWESGWDSGAAVEAWDVGLLLEFMGGSSTSFIGAISGGLILVAGKRHKDEEGVDS